MMYAQRASICCSLLWACAIAAPAQRVNPAPVTAAVQPVSPDDASAQAAPQALTIGSGDLIEVKTYGIQDLSDVYRVSGGGAINMPLIGDIAVAGNTPEQASKLIEGKLLAGGFVNKPHVVVSIKEYTTQTVSVIGEVQKPGTFPIINARRLMDAISDAGGLTETAGKTIIITHRGNATPDTIHWSYDAAKLKDNNVELHAGDSITVTKAGLIYVAGEVNRPGGFVMQNNEYVTVLQALALAEGPKSTAALNNVKIIRRTPNGPQEIKIALKDINRAKAPDVPMEANDVLFVPNSVGKNVGKQSLQSIIAITTGIAIYRP